MAGKKISTTFEINPDSLEMIGKIIENQLTSQIKELEEAK